MDADHVQEHIRSRAHGKFVVPAPGTQLSFISTLSQLEQVHLEGYNEIRHSNIQAGRLQPTDAYVCDLSQEPYVAGKWCSRTLNTLTRSSNRWSHHHQRCMLGVEALAAQGVPSGPLLASTAFAGSWQTGQINNIVAKKAFGGLSDTALRGLAGNAMHLHVAGALIAWQLVGSAPALCR
eukprot:4492388-Lingulodinium_polyedra.AAC.1